MPLSAVNAHELVQRTWQSYLQSTHLEISVHFSTCDDSRVLVRRAGIEALVGLVPVKDAARERADEAYASLCTRLGLKSTEHQGEIASDTFLLQDFGGCYALPCGRQLDENTAALDALILIHLDDATRPYKALLRVEGQPRIYFRAHVS